MGQLPRQIQSGIAWTLFLVPFATIGADVWGQDSGKSNQTKPTDRLPTLEKALAANTDVWGEAAMRRPEGPSYEFFAGLLPPLRYVNAAFRHYPIALSAPRGPLKARLVSNGSAINARANVGTWKEVGFPVRFQVGENRAPFGEDLQRLDGPHYAEGYLPVVEMSYREGEASYRQETFASVEPELAAQAAVFTSFVLDQGQQGEVAAQVDAEVPLHVAEGSLRDEKGRAFVWFDQNWQWDPSEKTLTALLSPDRGAVLAVFTEPVDRLPAPFVSADIYQEQRQECGAAWNGIFEQAAQLEVPETPAANAWRSLIIGNLMIANGDKMNYSAGNAYQQDYEAECGWAVRALLLYGFIDQARPMIVPLLDFRRQERLKYHNAGHKLQLLAHYYWLTHDAEFVRANRQRWSREAQLIIEGREANIGLLPPEHYCGDIHTKVYNLKSNANSWRGLRDLTAVLDDIGEPQPELKRQAEAFRQSILAAVAKSEDRNADPPFVPNALFGAEKPYQALTASKLGSYWCLLTTHLLNSRVFDSGPDKAQWIIDYLQRRGGLCMGMVRFDQHSGLFANERGLDDCYTLGYLMEILRRDQVDRALVTFYGKLAQGLTRDTFIGGEGTGLDPLDEHGRAMYLPPNCSGNALFLWTLRYLLVQDWDTDDDGKPDTLRLLFATPRRWLRDGAAVKFQGAPTAFGPMSLDVQSRLEQGEVVARVALPPRRPNRTLLRIRLPRGWTPTEAIMGDKKLPLVDADTVDLSDFHGEITVRVRAEREK